MQVLRALDSQDDMLDLSNGVKYGQSHAFNPGPPTADIQRFRRIALGSNENNSFNSEEYDRRSAAAFSGENRSREQKPTWRRAADQSSGELESDTRAMFWAEKSTGGRNHRRGFSWVSTEPSACGAREEDAYGRTGAIGVRARAFWWPGGRQWLPVEKLRLDPNKQSLSKMAVYVVKIQCN